jgi:hypothetical protein
MLRAMTAPMPINRLPGVEIVDFMFSNIIGLLSPFDMRHASQHGGAPCINSLGLNSMNMKFTIDELCYTH